MAADPKPVRVDIGFSGGQILALRMPKASLTALRKALDGDGGWHEVKGEDSEVAVRLESVVYVRLDTEQHRVGF